MEQKDTILIVIRAFPYNHPMSIRMRTFIKIFEELGYRCAVVCFYYTGEKSMEDGVFTYEQVNIYSVTSLFPNSKKWAMPGNFVRTFEKAIEREKPGIIFSCSLHQVFPKLYRVARRRHIPIILESCEWYNPSTFKYGRFDFHYLMHSICWKFYYPKVDAVIAISRLLCRHYQETVQNVIRIPTIMDTQHTNCRIGCRDADKVVLLFAGSLARTKDSIREFYEALELIEDAQRERIQFEVVGVPEDMVREHLGAGLFEKYRGQTNIYGRVHQSVINEKYIDSDFGIFFRPQQRSSEAGFSTKLGEGMSAGTPFIVNATGDIPLYLRSGENAFLVRNAADIAQVYRNLLCADREEMERIRENARKTAERDFDYHTYIQETDKLLRQLKERRT